MVVVYLASKTERGAGGMARNKSSTEGTPRDKTIAEMRAEFNAEETKRRQNHELAVDSLKKYIDPNKKADLETLGEYDRKKIRRYLKNLGQPSNQENLRKAAQYLYFRSQILYRMCHWYASMWTLDCRQVIPSYSLSKPSSNVPQTMLEQYEESLNILEAYDIQGNWFPVALRCYLEDACFTVFYRDKDAAFFYIMDPKECAIDGQYSSGEFSYSVDMSKWKSEYKRNLAEWLGEPFTTMIKISDDENIRWVHMPDEYGACFKFNSDRRDIVPPTTAILQQLAGLNDIADLQALKDEASVYKLLLLPMKTLAGAKNSDEWMISVDILLQYFDKLKLLLPEYVAAAPIPGELSNENVIDFSTTSVDKDIDRLQQSQDTLTSTSGAGILNMKYVNSNAALKAWLMAESEFAISSLLPQIEGFTNRMLSFDTKKEACTVKYFECTVFTKDDMQKSLLESCQYSFSNRLAYNTFNGISEKATLAMEFFETQVLHLPDIMTHPLQSSYTTSNTGDDVAGRPLTPDDELTDSGERSRNMSRSS